MAKGRIEFNTFVKGLVTEAGPLTYPEGASLDESNFVLNRDGSRQRRFGIQFEDGGTPRAATALETDDVLASFQWSNPANEGAVSFLVVQDSNTLRMYEANAPAVTAASVTFAGPQLVYTLPAEYATTVASTTSIDGKFYLAGRGQEVIEFSYDTDTELVSVRSFAIEMRDLWGVDDFLKVDERPASPLFSSHAYNLKNQGWPEEFDCSVDSAGEGNSIQDPVAYAELKIGVYPSNADLIHSFKHDTARKEYSVGTFSPWRMEQSAEGTSEAPKGTIILTDIWNRGAKRFSETGISGLPSDIAAGYITAVASYAGRLFYAFKQTSITNGDTNSPNLSTVIAFSQVGTENAAKCYTKNDPSAETFNDLLDTDGGFIVLPNVGEVYSLVVLGDSLIVVASNGVWEIHGGEKSFSSTNQSQSKVSKTGALSDNSVIAAEDAIAFWSRSGIQIISLDKVSMRASAQNATQTTIQKLYDEIPSTAKRAAVGVYDETSRQLRWLYRDKDLIDNKLFNQELVFDLNLTAFYKNSFADHPTEGTYAYPAGYVDVEDVLILTTQAPVTDGGIVVTDSSADVTATGRSIVESVRGSTKYITPFKTAATSWTYTVSQLRNLDFVDWVDLGGGVDSPAYLLTGYWTGGESSKDKRMPYLHTHFRRTEQGFDESMNVIGAGGCLVQVQWEWTDSVAAGRWGNEFQAYKLGRLFTPANAEDPMDYGTTVVSTKNKVRGHGAGMSISFKTEPAKDCHIYGWIIDINAEET
tara:strand:- start:6605 stop:8869 length:2265 start_codon:yes stop_codon:yes gene_type:complete